MAELKMNSSIEVVKNERKYMLHLDPQSPLGETFDALCEMQIYIVNRIQDSQQKKDEDSQPE